MLIILIHGSYCLTTEDASKDTKWTKIQQRCLVSERAGHCSNVNTPMAERSQRQSRRLKEVQLQNKKQKEQKEKEQRVSEEQKRRSTGTHSSRGAEGDQNMAGFDKENGDEERGNQEREREEGSQLEMVNSSKSVKLKSRRSLQFVRNDVRMVKSPTVKITRISSSHQRHSGFAKPLKPMGKHKIAALQTMSKSTTTREALRQTTMTNQEGRVPARVVNQGVILTSPAEDRTSLEDPATETQVNDSTVGQVSDESPAMECTPLSASPSSPACTSTGDNSGAWTSPVRRSPRLKGRPSDARKTASSSDSGACGSKRKKSDTERKKEKSLKEVSVAMRIDALRDLARRYF